MLMVIDVGNTNIVLGIYDGDELIENWRLSTIKGRTSDEYGLLIKDLLYHNGIKPEEIDDVIISSVVPNLLYTLPTTMNRYFNIDPFIVDDKANIGINIMYDNPEEVGADRIVNAVAVKNKYGGPAIIIDMGTAITFCVLDENDNYQGGVIVPGLSISSDALFSRAAKLPKVEIVKPQTVIGKTTVSSIQSGLVNGFIGLVDSIIEQIANELGRDIDDFRIIMSGGFSGLFSENSKYINTVDPRLTLEGLKIIYDLNRK